MECLEEAKVEEEAVEENEAEIAANAAIIVAVIAVKKAAAVAGTEPNAGPETPRVFSWATMSRSRIKIFP